MRTRLCYYCSVVMDVRTPHHVVCFRDVDGIRDVDEQVTRILCCDCYKKEMHVSDMIERDLDPAMFGTIMYCGVK